MSFQPINGEPSSSDDYHYLFKFLIIGDANTGKSCIMRRFLEDKFTSEASHTIGVEFSSKFISLGDKIIKLQIWDTAGQERFRSVTRSYYRGAAGALLVYDITNRNSYKSLMTWLADARYFASHQITVILVGNKYDLEQEREVLFLEASKFAQENDLIFVETSAKNGDNVEEAFLKCAKTILSRLETGEIEMEAIGPGIQIGRTQLRHIEEQEIKEIKKLRITECSQSCKSI